MDFQPKKTFFADMHTHSENSHDSVCKIEDMCLSEIEKGTEIMAVTDHCDIFLKGEYDFLTPIKNAYNTVMKLREKYSEQCLLLTGVEVSEGFWYPEQLEELYRLCDFDVILGSVHCVRYPNLLQPYSRIDFSALSVEEIYAYLDKYFDDVITMLGTTNFDILTHLTCPLRYINGKYSLAVDISRFAEKLDIILKEIIAKGIALEINTSSYKALNDFMPSADIIKRYHALGGYLVTLGSDAHISENVSIDFDKAIALLCDIGFENIYYYKSRKAIPISIGG